MAASAVSKMKVVELRAALKKRGLDSKGLKAALVARLEEAIAAEEANKDVEQADEGAEEEAEQVEVGAVEEAEQADEGPKQVNEAVSEPQGAAAGATVAPTVPAKKADAAEETPPVAAAAIDPTSDGSAARGMKRKAPADTSGPAATATATSTAASEWVHGVDPKSGHTYYYNTRTAESSWARPAGAISTPVHTHASVPAAAQMLDFSQPMDKSVVGRIIGTRGVNIKAVESTSGCKVFRQVQVDPHTHIVTFSGTETAVARAKQMVSELVAGRGAAGIAHYSSAYAHQNAGYAHLPAHGGYPAGQPQQRMWHSQTQQSGGIGSDAPPPPPEGHEKGAEGCSLLVRGLPPALSGDHLRAAFSSFGTLASATVASATGAAPVGYITFADAAAATKARAAMDGKNICGAKLFVSSL